MESIKGVCMTALSYQPGQQHIDLVLHTFTGRRYSIAVIPYLPHPFRMSSTA